MIFGTGTLSFKAILELKAFKLSVVIKFCIFAQEWKPKQVMVNAGFMRELAWWQVQQMKQALNKNEFKGWYYCKWD